MTEKPKTIMTNFHDEQRTITNEQEYQHLFTWKSDIMPKGKLIK